MDIDIHKSFLDNAMRFYTEPPLNGKLEIGVRDPALLKQLVDRLYAENEANPLRGVPLVKPGNKPELYLRWAFRTKGIFFNLELEAAEDRVGLTILGTF